MARPSWPQPSCRSRPRPRPEGRVGPRRSGPDRPDGHEVRGDEAARAGPELRSSSFSAPVEPLRSEPVPVGDQVGPELVADRAPVALEALAAAAGVHRAGPHGEVPVGPRPGRQVAHDRVRGLFVVDRHPGERVLDPSSLPGTASGRRFDSSRPTSSSRSRVRASELPSTCPGSGSRRGSSPPSSSWAFVSSRWWPFAAQLAGEDPHEQPEVRVLEQAFLAGSEMPAGRSTGAAAGGVPRRLVDQVAEGRRSPRSRRRAPPGAPAPPLSTRETVPRDPPARRATSSIAQPPLCGRRAAARCSGPRERPRCPLRPPDAAVPERRPLIRLATTASWPAWTGDLCSLPNSGAFPAIDAAARVGKSQSWGRSTKP